MTIKISEMKETKIKNSKREQIFMAGSDISVFYISEYEI